LQYFFIPENMIAYLSFYLHNKPIFVSDALFSN